MSRRPNWRVYLDGLINERLRRPFAWGSNDCALFAADAVEAVTGVDPAAGLRGMSVRQALRYVESAGGIFRLVPDALPLLPNASLAIDGDIAMIEQQARGTRRLALGVVHDGRILGPSRLGLAGVPMHRAIQCWGVGHG